MTAVSPSGPSPVAPAAARRSGDQLLVLAASFFAAAVLLHGADHARRGADSVGLDVFWVGSAAIALEVGVVVLACQRHRVAALGALAAGSSLALGYLVVHFLPERSWLSDSFVDQDGVSRLSLAAATLEVLAALTLGVVGLVVLRRRGGLVSAAQPNPGQIELRRALEHPAVVAMILGNAAILVISFVQLAR